MPELTGPQLTTLRTLPHRSKLYLIVQQAIHRESGAWTGWFWACQINGNPAGTVGDLVASLTVDNGEAAQWVLDGMTIFIGTTKGDHDKGIFAVRTAQNVDGATVSLSIFPSSEIVGVVEDDDWIVVLDEFRLLQRYPRVTEAGGVISWFKDYNETYAGLGGTAAARRQASLPAVPIMGPHIVRFIDPDDTVDIDFDWSDSYPTYPGATVNAWTSEGIRGTTSGNWNSAVENPPAQTYDGSSTDANNDISGLAGFRFNLTLGTDQQDPDPRFRRGDRYVFTLRRPGDTVSGIDPVNAEPIVDFSVDMNGSVDEGGWSASLTIFDSQAHEYDILEGALVILFAEDWYGDTEESVGPIAGSENVVLIGRIADGSVRQDPETGDVTFDVMSATGIAKNREMYPIPVENDDGAVEWYQCPDLTVDRAAWFYIVWHTTLAKICDWYWSGDTEEIRAMDFLAGDIYSVLNSFYQDRLFARVLSDRYERISAYIDRQMGIAGAGVTIFTLTDADWLEELSFREEIETEASIVELGGLNYNAGLITPYLSKAPGTVNRVEGSGDQNMSMALASQAVLNTLAGRRLAWANNRWPEATIQFGNWRVFDTWPQEYVIVSVVTERHTFSSDKFIPRSVRMGHDGESVNVAITAELETDGVAGQTIVIPDEIPIRTPPNNPRHPPGSPTGGGGGGEFAGRRMAATDAGVFVTDNIGAVDPVWYGSNAGFSPTVVLHLSDFDALDIKRDPFHWWTTGGEERTLWALTATGIWKQENFPFGTWTNEITLANIGAATGTTPTQVWYGRLAMSVEVEGLYAFTLSWYAPSVNQERWVFTVLGGVITQAVKFGDDQEWCAIRFAPHSNGLIIYVADNNDSGHAVNSSASLYKSINQGASYSRVDGPYGFADGGAHTSVSVPLVDSNNPDNYVLWGRGGFIAGAVGKYRISENQSATFADLGSAVDQYSKMGTGGHPDYIWLLSYQPNSRVCKYSVDRGVTYTELPLVPATIETYTSWLRWEGGVLQSALVAGYGIAGLTGPYVYRWTNGDVSWSDKSGNLEDFGVADIRELQRDSMGGA